MSVSWIEPDRNAGGAHRMHVLAEHDLPDVVEHEDQAERQQHLREVIAAVETADEDVLQQQAHDEGNRDAADHRQPEAAGGGRDAVGEIRAQHVERAVREIDDAEDAEHQRQAARDEEQDHSVLNGVQKLNAERCKVHEEDPSPSSITLRARNPRIPIPVMVRSAATRRRPNHAAPDACPAASFETPCCAGLLSDEGQALRSRHDYAILQPRAGSSRFACAIETNSLRPLRTSRR